MALAKQCDRCGGFYETSYRSAIEDFFYEASKIILPNRKREMVEEIEKIIDLCPECSNSLKMWFDEREKDNG